MRRAARCGVGSVLAILVPAVATAAPPSTSLTPPDARQAPRGGAAPTGDLGGTSLPQQAALKFVDVTVAAGLDVVHVPSPAVYSNWMTGGMAVGDFDRDGFDDLFVVSGGSGQPDRLFINRRDGTFENEAAAWGLTDVHYGNAAAAADYDGDGWIDLYVTSFGGPVGPITFGRNRLYHNDGGAGFTEVGEAAGVDHLSYTALMVFGAAWGDVDLDGDLDLFVTTWGTTSPGGAVPNDGNRLFRNDGDGTFTDVTGSAVEVGALNGVHGFQPAFADMDGDRWPELLIAADFETSRYLRNDAGFLVDVTAISGCGLDDNGMGQTIADFDRDGRLDWYVTSVYDDSPQPDNNPGNMLYRAVGAHAFDEAASEAGCLDGGWGWGTIAVDLDRDGWSDIVEVNGWEWNPPGQWTTEAAKLFRNQHDGTFLECADGTGLHHRDSGRAVVTLDLENDGDLDVIVFTNKSRLYCFSNQTTGAGHWLDVALDRNGRDDLAPDGFGSRIVVTRADGVELIRMVNGQPSYLATSSLRSHFGLGGAYGPVPVVDVRVDWNSGQTTVLADVLADRAITIKAPPPADVDGDETVDVHDFIGVLLRWGSQRAPGVPPDPADVTGDGTVDVEDLLAVLLP